MGNTEYSEEGKAPEATCYRGYGMYCLRSSLQFTSDILRENLTCFTFTILDICRSVQQVFLFCLYFVCFCLVFFLPVQVNTPCRFERTRSHKLTSFPLIAPYTVAQPHGLVCQGV